MNYLIVILISIILTGCNKQTTSLTESPLVKEVGTVPLPTEKDAIRTFFSLINEKRIPEAIGMLDKSLISDNTARQAYGVQFNNFGTVTIKSIDNTSENHKYKVVFDTKNGTDTRWVTIQKDNSNLWKITEIATGP